MLSCQKGRTSITNVNSAVLVAYPTTSLSLAQYIRQIIISVEDILNAGIEKGVTLLFRRKETEEHALDGNLPCQLFWINIFGANSKKKCQPFKTQ